MSDIGRVITTIAIWSALVGILILGNLTSDTVVWVTLIISIAAAASTGAIWKSAESDRGGEAAHHSKQKRTNRTARFVEKMDEDQLVELEELLAARREDRLIDR